MSQGYLFFMRKHFPQIHFYRHKTLASYSDSHKCSNDADGSDHVEDCDNPEEDKHPNCTALFIRSNLGRKVLRELWSSPYIIFVISFTQAGFSNTKFYTQKNDKKHQNIRNISEKSNICSSCAQSGKFYT